MDFNLEETIATLADVYGEKRIGVVHHTEVVAIPKERRKEILRHLVNTAKEKGQDSSYFKKGTVQTVIIKACFPDALTRHWNKEKREGAYSVTIRELKEILAEIWPEEYFPASPPERMEECNLPPPNTKEWNPSKQGRIGKELDRSVVKDMPRPSTAEDAEAAELLGGNDE